MKIGSTEDGGRMPVEKNPPVAVKTEPGEDWTKDLGKVWREEWQQDRKSESNCCNDGFSRKSDVKE